MSTFLRQLVAKVLPVAPSRHIRRVAVFALATAILALATPVFASYELGSLITAERGAILHDDRLLGESLSVITDMGNAQLTLFSFAVNPAGDVRGFNHTVSDLTGDTTRLSTQADTGPERSATAAVSRALHAWLEWVSREMNHIRENHVGFRAERALTSAYFIAAQRLYSAISAHKRSDMAQKEAEQNTVTLVISGVAALIIAMIFVVFLQALRAVSREEQARQHARKSDQAALREAARYQCLFDTSPDGIVVADLTATITMCNQRAADMVAGGDRSLIVGRSIFDFLSPQEGPTPSEGFQDIIGNSVSRHGLNYTLLPIVGRPFPVEISASPVLNADGKAESITGVIRDTTDRQEAEHQLRFQATHDALTHLPNRVLLHERIGHSIQMCRRYHREVSLLLVDLDRFKEINDTFGHGVGDLVLRSVAEKLQSLMRGTDTVARLGGDEFAILLPETGGRDARHMAETIRLAVAEPIHVAGSPFVVDCSIGVAGYPDAGLNATGLLRCADIAMYDAKNRRTGVARYRSRIDSYTPDRIALASDLRKAVADGGLELHYQPKLDLRSGTIDSFEALLRWNHPTRGPIEPTEIVSLAERIDLIGDVTTWVLRRALTDVAEWSEHRDHPISVAVNLSPLNLRDVSLSTTVGTLLSETGVAAEQLRLEVTESVLMADPNRGVHIMRQLRRRGVRFSIDDFGTGYSSMSRLKRMVPDELKIDRSFVGTMRQDTTSFAIVESVIRLSRSLGRQVVAEGVEDQETFNLLRELDCDLIQGYWVSRAMPGDAVVPWLQAWDVRPPVLRDTLRLLTRAEVA